MKKAQLLRDHFPTSHFLLVIRSLRVLRIFRVLKLIQYLGEANLIIQALQASRENAASNGVSQQLSALLPQDLETGNQYDLVLANILSGPLTELAPTLAQHCHPGSDIVLSGILLDQAESVRNAYTDMFDMSPERVLNDWVLLHGKRKAGGSAAS